MRGLEVAVLRLCKESVESGTGEHPWLHTFKNGYPELSLVVGNQV